VPLNFEQAAGLLGEVGERFDARNWVLGTSGNFSVVLGRDPLRLAMTRSGMAKGRLDPDANRRNRR
jgi:methylthioribulose-1-phosphate dehydratase